MKAKEIARDILLKYMGNPENDFPNRTSMNCDVLGYKSPAHIYRLFSTDELYELEAEALEMRRKKYKPEIARVDKALIKEAKDGNVQAAKLVYQKFEAWSEKQKVEHGLDATSVTAILNALSDDDARAVRKALESTGSTGSN